MTRMNPLRRLAATAAIVGVTGFGAVALAAPAMAAPAGAVTTTAAAPATITLPSLNQMTLGDLMGSLAKANGLQQLSPVPAGAIAVKVGPLKLTFQADAAQDVQNVLANFYENLGYQIAFNGQGVLVIGDKICDVTKSATWNKGCVVPDTTSRF